ncbi:type VI secretion system protein TssA [Paraburkholderia fungorum]|uniref:type VI secretion system protein TssA n=1 Tax=Paraburkholderia fungorum TaxID=134537 RepID=UPI0038B8846F
MNAPLSLDRAPALAGIDALLVPLEHGDGVGTSLRNDPVYQQIRDARRQDDPSLPMREWERPLTKADWKTVVTLADDALRTRSKDFQLAAWLCEAWTHQRRLDGFVDGMRLLHALAGQFWEHAYPQLEDGDAEARVAPFVWINHTLALVLRLQIPLLSLSVEPSSINLDDWSRITGRASERDDDGLTRESLDGEVGKGSNLADLLQLEERVGAALDITATLERSLDERLGQDAPGFSRVMEALMDLQRAARSLRGDRQTGLTQFGDATQADETQPVQDVADFADMQHGNQHGPHAFADEVRLMPTASAGTHGPIRDRAHAYRLLQDVADYLSKHEPHSPTPYLLRRAVAWGGMPLPDLLREVVQQEGDLSRYLAMLGLP